MTAARPGGRAASAPLMGHETEPTIFEMSVPGRSALPAAHDGRAGDAARASSSRPST